MGNQSSTGKCSSKEEYKTSTSSSSTENPTFGNGTAINKFYLEIVEELNKKRAEVDDLKLENSKMKGLCERIDHPAIDKYETEMLQLQKAHAEKEEMFQAAISRLNDAITSLKATVADSVITNSKLKTKNAKYEAKYERLSEYYQKQNTELQTEIDQLKETVASLQTNVTNSFTRSSHLKAENARLHSQLNKFTQCADTHKRNDVIQKLQAECSKFQDWIKKLKEEKSKLVDPNRLCVLDDIVDYGNIDYENLTEKILLVKNLENIRDNWFVDDVEICFESSDFQLCIRNELIAKRVSLAKILKRFFYSNLEKIYSVDVTISYNGYKKMVESQNLHTVSLLGITVKDEHGIKIDIAQLFKELLNVERFEYIFQEDEVTVETAEELVKLPPFSKLQEFNLSEVTEIFDLKMFAYFIIKNPTVSYHLSFRCSPKDYAKIKNVEKDVIASLPSTIKLQIVALK